MSGVAVRVSAKLKGLGGFPVKGGYLLGPPDLDTVDRQGELRVPLISIFGHVDRNAIFWLRSAVGLKA